MNPLFDLATRRAVLAAIIAAVGLYDAINVRLYQQLHSFSPDDTLATFTAPGMEATFTGYAPIGPLVWGAVVDNPDGSAITYAQLCQWTCTSAATPQDIFGGFWDEVAAGPVHSLKGQWAYSGPQPARKANDAIFYQPALVF
jgi:hypothetical protein